MIHPRRALLEEGSDNDGRVFLRQFLESLRRGAGNGFGEFEIVVVFALAKVLRTKQLLGANDLRALLRSRLRQVQSFLQIIGWVGRAAGLDEPELYDGRGFAHGAGLCLIFITTVSITRVLS